MCCHPALALEAQVALTLRAVAGLSTEEIARAFLVAPDTMKRRLTRAKAKIKLAGIPFGVPADPRLGERLAAVLAVVYLVFNRGYGDDHDRSGLAAEAIRLGRVLAALLLAEPEVGGLLALMLLHDARRDARFAGEDLVLLADQDRSRWIGARSRTAAPCLTGPCSIRPGLTGPARAVRHPGGDRVAASGIRARLAADRGPLRQARRPDRLRRGAAEPGGRGRGIARPGGRARHRGLT